MNKKLLGNNFTVYLAGPIKDDTVEHAIGWREKAERLFIIGNVLNPLRGKINEYGCLNIDKSPEIPLRDINDVLSSDCLLVMDNGIVSLGTAIEVWEAGKRGIPIFVVSEGNCGAIVYHPFTASYVTKLFYSIESAIKHILEVMPLWCERR